MAVSLAVPDSADGGVADATGADGGVASFVAPHALVDSPTTTITPATRTGAVQIHMTKFAVRQKSRRA